MISFITFLLVSGANCGVYVISLQESLDQATHRWGIKVERVEIKDVMLPQQMQRAMAAEAEASREARAKVNWGLQPLENQREKSKNNRLICVSDHICRGRDEGLQGAEGSLSGHR